MGKTRTRRSVLIVDDQEPMRLLLAEIVTQELAADISLAGTCEAALRLASQKTYDLILLDLMIPGIGGFEVLKRSRTDSANKSTPLVVVSVLRTSIIGDEPLPAERAKAFGANAVVSKPFSRSGLVAAVRAQLRANV